MRSQFSTWGAEVISEVEGAHEQDGRAGVFVPPVDACGFGGDI